MLPSVPLHSIPSHQLEQQLLQPMQSPQSLLLQQLHQQQQQRRADLDMHKPVANSGVSARLAIEKLPHASQLPAVAPPAQHAMIALRSTHALQKQHPHGHLRLRCDTLCDQLLHGFESFAPDSPASSGVSSRASGQCAGHQLVPRGATDSHKEGTELPLPLPVPGPPLDGMELLDHLDAGKVQDLLADVWGNAVPCQQQQKQQQQQRMPMDVNHVMEVSLAEHCQRLAAVTDGHAGVQPRCGCPMCHKEAAAAAASTTAFPASTEGIAQAAPAVAHVPLAAAAASSAGIAEPRSNFGHLGSPTLLPTVRPAPLLVPAPLLAFSSTSGSGSPSYGDHASAADAADAVLSPDMGMRREGKPSLCGYGAMDVNMVSTTTARQQLMLCHLPTEQTGRDAAVNHHPTDRMQEVDGHGCTHPLHTCLARRGLMPQA